MKAYLFQTNALLWEYIQLLYEKSTEWEIYISISANVCNKYHIL